MPRCAFVLLLALVAVNYAKKPPPLTDEEQEENKKKEPRPGASMEKSNQIFEKLRTAKGHFLGQATEEEMTHLGDHLGFNGLAFGGFFDSAATQLIEDFKAISEDQVIFSRTNSLQSQHKRCTVFLAAIFPQWHGAQEMEFSYDYRSQ